MNKQVVYPSVIQNMPNTEYHAHEATGSSLLRQIDIPAKFKYTKIHPPEYKECYRSGSATHTKVLEPDKIRSEYVIAPNIGKRSASDREQWEAFFMEHGADDIPQIISKPARDWYAAFYDQTGKTILTAEELSQIEQRTDAVYNNPEAKKLLVGGHAEVSLFWQDKETGLYLKCRPDYLSPDFCVDLKTTQNATRNNFAKTIVKYGYHVQAAMYLDGIKQTTGNDAQFRFIVVEKQAPYLTAVYQLNDESMELGTKLYREYLNKLADCMETDDWPGLENDLNLQLPVWAFDMAEAEVSFEGVTL